MEKLIFSLLVFTLLESYLVLCIGVFHLPPVLPVPWPTVTACLALLWALCIRDNGYRLPTMEVPLKVTAAADRDGPVIQEFFEYFPTVLLRLGIIVPFAIYKSFVDERWNAIRDDGLLENVLDDAKMLLAEQTAKETATFGLWWTLVALAITVFVPPPFSFVTSFVDVTVSLQLIQTTFVQSNFHVLHPMFCSRSAGPQGLSHLPEATGNFITYLQYLTPSNTTQMDFSKLCKSYETQHQYGEVLSLLYPGLAATGIIYFAIDAFYVALTAYGVGSLSYSYNSIFYVFAIFFQHIVGIPRWIFWILALPLYYFPLLVFRAFLPADIQTVIRYPRRLALKIYHRLAQRSTASKKATTPEPTHLDAVPLPNSPVPTLASFLSIYDILLLVSPNLHSRDLLNLALTSRDLHSAILGSDPLTHYNRYTCHPNKKKGHVRCWLCDIPCCPSCSITPTIRQSRLQFHAECCKPYCHGCYVKHMHRAPYAYHGKELFATTCQCRPEPSRFDPLWRYLSEYTDPELAAPFESRRVCKECMKLGREGVAEKRDRRTRWELMHPEVREGMDSCVKCKKDVKGGLRWWVCKGCNMECTSGVHLA